jgi:hypothetical protein
MEVIFTEIIDLKSMKMNFQLGETLNQGTYGNFTVYVFSILIYYNACLIVLRV